MSSPVPRIVDPHAVPVVGTDAHLPAVDPARLTPAALRQRFRSPPPWQAEIRGDVDMPPALLRPASVLVPLVQRADGLRVLLTLRTEHLRDHAGQISFPGGRAEQHDADAAATALREAEEEIGLPRSAVDVIGQLPSYNTITRFRVTPVVALVRPPFTLHPDSFEVAEAFEVPLQFLMTPAHHQRHAFELLGRQRQFLSMPWQGIDAHGAPREYFIWGATAAMLRNLYGLLRG
ncbi:MAG TPA: CoA pyrophosphatase [Rubrivivax sp.]|nr:CoA pyrophosphatase [Rubrivivax sp.]HPO20347.1 CoA pyrophosphatase [Rubrivivax sp.]